MKKLSLFFLMISMSPLTMNSMQENKQLPLPTIKTTQASNNNTPDQDSTNRPCCPTREEIRSVCSADDCGKCVGACGLLAAVACIVAAGICKD